MPEPLLKRNMKLFGLPYQFMDSVDTRVETISKTVGRKFAENIILDAPVITMIPGKPKYLPASKDKQTISQSLILASNDDFNPLKEIINSAANNNEVFKYYDFERSYTEYMKYVNIMCRTCATFLEIPEEYGIDGPWQQYDYRNYNWNVETSNGFTAMERAFNSAASKMSALQNSITSKLRGTDDTIEISQSDTNINSKNGSSEILYETDGSDTESSTNIEDLLTNYNFVQFFVDSDVSFSESMSNETTTSKLKGIFDSGSDMLKEVAFIANSGGLDPAALQEFADSSMQAVADTLGGVNGSITGALSRVLSLSSNIAKGENIIMPDIYQSSSYTKSYTFTVHLKTPYGTKFGYFMDICVPLMHLLCLGIPKQTTSNTYGAPFLIKAYCEGIFTCNLGIVSSIQITKGINNAYSTDGLPTEVDVSVTLTDLYSDLSMSPQSSPLLFVNNSSLVEYLATTCGLSLITPNLEKRFDMVVGSLANSFFDIDDNIMDSVNEALQNTLLEFYSIM